MSVTGETGKDAASWGPSHSPWPPISSLRAPACLLHPGLGGGIRGSLTPGVGGKGTQRGSRRLAWFVKGDEK